MKIDFTTKLKNIFGKDEDITLGKVTYEALLADVKENELPPKIDRYKIAKKAASEKVQDITIEELAIIKKMIDLAWPTAVVGAAFDIIEK